MNKILDNLADLLKVKSLVTLSMTAVMVAMLVGKFSPEKEFVALFSTSYGAIITYFFTKDNNKEVEPIAKTFAEPEIAVISGEVEGYEQDITN